MSEEEKEEIELDIEAKYVGKTEKEFLSRVTYAECLYILTPENKYCDKIRKLSVLKICEIIEKLQKENNRLKTIRYTTAFGTESIHLIPESDLVEINTKNEDCITKQKIEKLIEELKQDDINMTKKYKEKKNITGELLGIDKVRVRAYREKTREINEKLQKLLIETKGK